MLKSVIQTLRRLLALLSLTGVLAQGGAAAPPEAVEAAQAQYPAYAALLPDASRFDGDSYIGDNALVLLEQHSSTDGALSSAYTFADIYLPDVHALRAWYQDDPDDSLEGTADIRAAAAEVCAAFAVNGDFYTAQGVTAVRNGRVLNSCVSTYDLCVLYEDGRMRTFRHEELPAQDFVNAALEGAWQVWAFGPVLLNDDGSAIEDFSVRTPEYFTRLHPRTAIGYFGPGHYCLVSVSGYRDDMPGVTLEELSGFFASLGCRQAFNLDGGHSTHIWYQGREIGHPSMERALSDLIYIRDTTQEDDTARKGGAP